MRDTLIWGDINHHINRWHCKQRKRENKERYFNIRGDKYRLLIPMMHNPRITLCHAQIFRKIWQYFVMAQMIRIGTLIYIEKWCLIAVINMVNYIVGFLLTFFNLLLLSENCSSCSIFIVLNSRHDVVNINIRYH
jgi:hypothetical protein